MYVLLDPHTAPRRCACDPGWMYGFHRTEAGGTQRQARRNAKQRFEDPASSQATTMIFPKPPGSRNQGFFVARPVAMPRESRFIRAQCSNPSSTPAPTASRLTSLRRLTRRRDRRRKVARAERRHRLLRAKRNPPKRAPVRLGPFWLTCNQWVEPNGPHGDSTHAHG